MTRLRFLAMSLILVGLCSPLAVGTPADDKSDKDPTPRMRGQLPQNYNKLGLSDAQKQDIYRIRAAHRDKIDALQKQIDKLRADERKAIEKVLTPAQKERLREILAGKGPSDK